MAQNCNAQHSTSFKRGMSFVGRRTVFGGCGGDGTIFSQLHIHSHVSQLNAGLKFFVLAEAATIHPLQLCSYAIEGLPDFIKPILRD